MDLMALEFLLKPFDKITEMFRLSRTTGVARNSQKKRRAISPVIATVILVSTAVVISAAMAGFAGSLFSTYSQTSQVKIRDATFSNSAQTVTINFVNAGSASDILTSVSIPFGSTILTATGVDLSPNPAVIQPNTTTPVTATFTGTMPAIGQHITMTAVTAGGGTYTLSVIVGN